MPISSPNTTLEPVKPTATTILHKIAHDAIPSQHDENIARLEMQLQKERDDRKEERFYWIMAATIIADFMLFKFLDSWPTTIPIFLLELIMLVGLAKMLGVDFVYVLLERLFHKYLPKDADKAK